MEEQTKSAPNRRNYKIMVNFLRKKIVHTTSHVGSKEYSKLITMGYVNVGVIKSPETNFFWNLEYFEPESKYLRVNESHDQINKTDA